MGIIGCQRVSPIEKTSSMHPIVFSRLTGDYWQLWLMNVDGSGPTQLTSSASDKRYPVWSHDNQKVLFRNNNNQVFLFDLQTSRTKQVLKNMGFVGSVALLPHSSRPLFVRFRSEIMDSSDLWLSSFEGDNRHILTRDIGLQYDPAWSPNGEKIAYISGHGYQTHELFVMDVEDGNKVSLTDNKALELLPTFSPDGKMVAYVSDISGDFEIWLMSIDGSNPQRLTFSDGLDSRPCWSPDGRHILFVSNRDDNLQLWMMNRDGTNPRQLTTGPPSMDPAWRRDIIK